MHEPIAVSVIIPVWNAEAYLTECLDSVLAQSIGLDRIQVRAVDDGSTDQSGAILDAYAARFPQITALHESGSGGPGRPRNVGLAEATGRFVFFLDADDYLGDEALERLVTMADRCGSDIVLGRMVGTGGRSVPDVYQRTLERAEIEQVYKTVSVLKLFRRSLIDRLGLRFEEGLSGHEDGPFTIRAYFEASRISVLADYDCYYVRPSSKTRPKVERLRYLRGIEDQRMAVVASYRHPGIRRDLLMIRHIVEVVAAFKAGRLEPAADERQRVFDAGSAIIRRWHTERMQRRLPPWAAVRARCLQDGLRTELDDIVAHGDAAAMARPVVEGHRVFAGYPHFRDAAGIPDRDFEVTSRLALSHHLRGATIDGGVLRLAGEAYLAPIGGTTTVVLQRWPWGRAFRHPTVKVSTPGLRDGRGRYPAAGYATAIDLATASAGRPLPTGSWDVLVSVGIGAARHAGPIRVPADGSFPDIGRSVGATEAGMASARLDLTTRRALRLRIGSIAPWVRWLEAVESSWGRVRHLAGRAIATTRWGRLVGHVLREVRPSRTGDVGDP